MIILILLVTIVVIGFLLYNNDYVEWGIGLICIGGFLLFIALVLLPIYRIDVHAKEKKLNAFKESLKTARDSGKSLESATITIKIAEWNEDIAEMKYYNDTWFDIWIPDSFANQEPIK